MLFEFIELYSNKRELSLFRSDINNDIAYRF